MLQVGGCDSFYVDERPGFRDAAEHEERIAPRRTLRPVSEYLSAEIIPEVNLTGRSPLTGRVSFTTIPTTKIEIRVLGDEEYVYGSSEFSQNHELPIVGLYPGQTNAVEIAFIERSGQYGVDTLFIDTDPLPDYFPTVEVLTADRSRMEPGWHLSDFSLADNGRFLTKSFIFDDNGDIRWYLDLEELGGMAFFVDRLANGNFITSFGRFVYEYDILGNEINQWEMPGYWYHHDIVEKPDGNFIVAVNKASLDTIEDHVVELDRTTGAIVREWDIREILDVSRRAWGGTDNDWFHMNSVWYDETDASLIISGRNQGVIKVSRENELIWILAPHRGWGPAGVDGTGDDTNNFLLTAVDDTGVPYDSDVQDGSGRIDSFDWVWGQHAAMPLPDGTIFIFDNGGNRGFDPQAPPYSRGVVYDVDEQAMTVRQVWEFGKERGADFFSAIISDVDYLYDSGNRLIAPGIIFSPTDPRSIITEVTEAGSVVFDAQVHFKNLRSTGELAWGQFDLSYRAGRMELFIPTTQ